MATRSWLPSLGCAHYQRFTDSCGFDASAGWKSPPLCYDQTLSQHPPSLRLYAGQTLLRAKEPEGTWRAGQAPGNRLAPGKVQVLSITLQYQQRGCDQVPILQYDRQRRNIRTTRREMLVRPRREICRKVDNGQVGGRNCEITHHC